MGNSNSFDDHRSQFDDGFIGDGQGPIQQQFDEPEIGEVRHCNPQNFYKMKAMPVETHLQTKALISAQIFEEHINFFTRAGDLESQLLPHERSFLVKIDFEDLEDAKFFTANKKKHVAEKQYISLKFKSPINLEDFFPDAAFSKAQSHMLLLQAKEKRGLQAIRQGFLHAKILKKKKAETAAAGITSPKTREMEWAAASRYWEGRGQEHAEFKQLEADERRLQGALEKANREIWLIQSELMRGTAGVTSLQIDEAEAHADKVHDELREKQRQLQEAVDRKNTVVKAVAKKARHELANSENQRPFPVRNKHAAHATLCPADIGMAA